MVAAPGSPTPTRRRVTRGTLTRDDIVTATLDLIESAPDQPVTMQRVAAALGTRPMSLYTHVRNRDDLIDGAVDRSLRAWTFDVAEDAPWELQLGAWCRSLRDHARRWPPLIDEMTRNGSFQPGLLEKVAVLARILRAAGLEGRDLAGALRWIPQTVLGAIVLELARPRDLQSADDETTAILGSIAQLTEQARAELLSVIPYYSERDLPDLFDYSVDRVVDGVRNQSARRRATGGTT
ncbi:MAG: TetR/AcrR family transcriptional regulator [Microthrixaceae bacterium]